MNMLNQERVDRADVDYIMNEFRRDAVFVTAPELNNAIAALANLVKTGKLKTPNRSGGANGPEIIKKIDGLDVTLNDLVVNGNLTVSGTTTTVDTATLVVEDKNIEMGNVGTPTDVTADGGGITLKGSTDKTLIWDNANDNWTFNQDVNIATGLVFRVNNVDTLSATTLGSAVVGSSLTSVGTLTGLQVDGNSGVGTSTFGTNATRSLAIAIGVEPAALVAGQFEIFCKDSTTGSANATLGIFAEEPVVTEGWTQSDTFRIWINSTEYKLGLDAV